ncbi:unnamed protein product [Cylicostephanus goldi]|uniref:Uncharacterized protein n=1 Tax=Cylicostephanus goldi TaxID=71465 RepID=A0A3P6V360_CYLGO|nr:unnamed protein product [Cylicostephanus goldi]
MIWCRILGLALLATAVSSAAQKTDDLECMFLGYPDLEYDGFDRTEVGRDCRNYVQPVLGTSC